MAKEQIIRRYLQCSLCGGISGTLVRVGDKYRHARTEDCARHRAEVKAKLRHEEALRQARRGSSDARDKAREDKQTKGAESRAPRQDERAQGKHSA